MFATLTSEQLAALPAGVDPGDVGVSRKSAMAGGQRYYFSRSCKRGHAGLRRTSDRGCVECKHESGTSEGNREYCRQYRADHLAGISQMAGLQDQ